MAVDLFSSNVWTPALNKFAETTALTIALFDAAGRLVLTTQPDTPLVALFREHGADPGLFEACAERCLRQSGARPAVVLQEMHGLAVVGTSLVLEDQVVGAAIGGYALAAFSQVAAVQRWAGETGVPFDRLWNLVRRHPPAPERRLHLQGELLQVLGDALLRENLRTRQYEETAAELRTAAAAKDEFLAVLSHELQTPLATITTWTGVLRHDRRPEQQRRGLAAIERSAALQSAMVEDLLDVNRIAHGTVELDLRVENLGLLVRQAVEMSTAGTAGPPRGVAVRDCSEPLFVRGDAGRLQQIVRNVVSNAIKFTPPDGLIEVAVARDGDEAVVTVADSGRGIEPAFLPFVFDIFQQEEHGTRRSHGGLGIGLAIVKRLVELHGGSVAVASPGTGRGCTVTVRLQTVEPPELVDPLVESEADAAPLAGISVLVVEDTDAARDSLRFLLEALGARVMTAADGCEALDVLAIRTADIVLCDLRMPRLDGYELLSALRRQANRTPVVAVSAFATAQDRERTRAAGFDGHVNKPFDETDIIVAVSAALGH